jgi:hypothetical protein
MKVAEERDKGVERGRALNSKNKKTVFAVLMEKQGGREEKSGVVDGTGTFIPESQHLVLDLDTHDNGTYVLLIFFILFRLIYYFIYLINHYLLSLISYYYFFFFFMSCIFV